MRLDHLCELFLQAGYDMPTISRMTPEVSFGFLRFVTYAFPSSRLPRRILTYLSTWAHPWADLGNPCAWLPFVFGGEKNFCTKIWTLLKMYTWNVPPRPTPFHISKYCTELIFELVSWGLIHSTAILDVRLHLILWCFLELLFFIDASDLSTFIHTLINKNWSVKSPTTFRTSRTS